MDHQNLLKVAVALALLTDITSLAHSAAFIQYSVDEALSHSADFITRSMKYWLFLTAVSSTPALVKTAVKRVGVLPGS